MSERKRKRKRERERDGHLSMLQFMCGTVKWYILFSICLDLFMALSSIKIVRGERESEQERARD